MQKAIALLKDMTADDLGRLNFEIYSELKFNILPKLKSGRNCLDALYSLIYLFRNEARYSSFVLVELLNDHNVLMLGALRRFLIEINNYLGPESNYPKESAVEIRIALSNIAVEIGKFMEKEILTSGSFMEKILGKGGGEEHWRKAERYFSWLVISLETKNNN